MGTLSKLRKLEGELEAHADDNGSQDADPEFAQIHFSENFRKAKRNSLIWSSLSALAAMGTPANADGSSNVSLFQLGLSYEHWEVITVCLLASTFMIFGYYRSDRTLSLLNSRAFRKRRLSDFSRIISMLTADAVSLGATLDRVRNRASELRELLPNAGKGDFPIIEELERGVAEIKEGVGQDSLMSGRSGQAVRIVDVEERRLELEKKLNALGAYIAKAREGLPANWFSEFKSIEREMEYFSSEALQGSKALSGFDDQIGKGERSWHLWYDQVPVYTLYAVSAVLSISTLVWLFF